MSAMDLILFDSCFNCAKNNVRIEKLKITNEDSEKIDYVILNGRNVI
jgi:hypothetical protein